MRARPVRASRRAWLQAMLDGVVGGIVLTGGGCRSRPSAMDVPVLGSDWRQREGQAVWRRHTQAPEMTCELVFRSDERGGVWLIVSKAGLPLVLVRLATGSWMVSVPSENRSWSGRGQPSARLGWAQLARCLAGQTPDAAWRWAPRPEGQWRLERDGSGEFFEGYLAP